MKSHFFVLLQLVGTLVALPLEAPLVATSDAARWGKPLQIQCRSDRPIDSCQFHILGFQTNIKLFPGVRHPNYTFVGDFEKGDCSILVNSASPSNHGPARCQVMYPKGDRLLDETEVDVQVQHPPEAISLSSNGNFVHHEGDTLQFNCTSVGGYPPPTLILRLDDEVLAQSNNSMALTHTRKANHSDHFKKVFCTADHPELLDQFIWSRNLDIKYAPLRGNYSVTGRGLNMSISVQIWAFPKPHLVQWSSPQGPLQADTYQAREEFTQHQDRGIYVYQLQVSPVTEETNKILLTVENELGKREFDFKLDHATSRAPGSSRNVWLILVLAVRCYFL